MQSFCLREFVESIIRKHSHSKGTQAASHPALNRIENRTIYRQKEKQKLNMKNKKKVDTDIYLILLRSSLGFPGVSVVKIPPANAADTRCRFHSWVGKIPWRRAWKPTPVFFPWRIPWTEEHGRL